MKKIDLSTTHIMGILNLTDNSFYDGNKYNTQVKAINQVRKMIIEGATIIDIGAQSSKPGSEEISEEEEWNRIKDVLKEIRNEFKDVLISIDTYRSSVAEKSINNGADIINDISSGNLDKNMFTIIAKYQIPYILMHMQNNPKNMQNNPTYDNVVKEIIEFFKEKINILNNLGIFDLIIDPGFGFGKTLIHNYIILNNLKKFRSLNLPILTGCSRKSMIYNLLECDAESALNGTTITNTLALANGSNILRVHDVKEAVECAKIVNFAQNN